MAEKRALLVRTDMAKPTLVERIQACVFPGVLIVMSIYHHILGFLHTILFQWTLPDIETFRDKGFSRMWLANGESMAVGMPPDLLNLLPTLRGTVLDIGPGSGEQLHNYTSSSVNAYYAAEPATLLHPKLEMKAKSAGIADKYHVLTCGAEPLSLIPALSKAGLLKGGNATGGVFDDIVSIRVLCGVPELKETVEGLYQLLKPGGRLIFFEHVVAPWQKEGSMVARVLQSVYMWLWGWRFWMGGCNLDRNTGMVMREAGKSEKGLGWSKIEMRIMEPWSTVPHIVGYMVKK